MLNKRGQGLQISTIILVVLGVAVLVLLIWGFVVGFDKLLPWLSPGNNVEAIVSQCQAACATGNTYGYCTMERTLKAEDLPNGDKEVKNTCKYFSTLTNTAGSSYSIEPCLALC